MSAFKAAITKQIADITQRIAEKKTHYDAEIADLQAKKTALQDFRNAVTPEFEAAATALENAGLDPRHS